MRPALTLLILAAGLTGACARQPEPPRYAASYPGQPVRSVTGTNYVAYPGLPAPPANAEGVVPPPPPRYMGSSASASSGNVGGAEVRRDAMRCVRSGWMLDLATCD